MIEYQLDNKVSLKYNDGHLYVNFVERDGGPVIDTYYYEYDPDYEHWEMKQNLRRHY